MKRTALTTAITLTVFALVFAATGLIARGEEFTDALNTLRRDRGLRPVVYDVRLDGIAKTNNDRQAVRGQGHWHTGGFGQCSYVGPADKLGALFGFNIRLLNGIFWHNIGYVESASHAAILFNPDAKRIAVHHTDNRNTVVIAFDDPPFDPATTYFGSPAAYGLAQQSKPATSQAAQGASKRAETAAGAVQSGSTPAQKATNTTPEPCCCAGTTANQAASSPQSSPTFPCDGQTGTKGLAACSTAQPRRIGARRRGLLWRLGISFQIGNR